MEDVRERISEIWSEFKSILNVVKVSRSFNDLVAEINAREEIRELLATYTYYWNSKDVDGLMSIMSDDCEIVHGKPYTGHFIGKHQVKKFFDNILENAPKKGLRLQDQEDKHHISNVIIKVDKELKKAEVSAYFFRVSTGKKEEEYAAVIATGWYRFTLKKEGEWKIQRIKIFRCFESEPFKIMHYL